MKRIFKLTHPKIKPARLADSAKSDIKKHIKKERQKVLPKGVDFWNFNCKAGPTSDNATVIHVNDIAKFIDSAVDQQLESVYVEICPEPGYRMKLSTQYVDNHK